MKIEDIRIPYLLSYIYIYCNNFVCVEEKSFIIQKENI